MENISVFEKGPKPFKHDEHRGKWASSKDFFFACAGNAFKAESLMVMPLKIFADLGIFGIVPYLLISAVCSVPLLFLQSFLGQFSSTGFISALRISPIFKGIGYVSLVVNFSLLMYYSVFSAIPLFYLYHSMQPTIPWSCDSTDSLPNLKEFEISLCHFDLSQPSVVIIPSVKFLTDHLGIPKKYDGIQSNSFSFQLMICCWVIWGTVAVVISKSTASIGRFLRFSFITMVAIMGVCLLRFAFLPGAVDGLRRFLWVSYDRVLKDTWLLVPSIVVAPLGSGWGSVLTMASFNNFKTNIFKYSWILCIAQMGLMIGMTLLSIFIHYYMGEINVNYYTSVNSYRSYAQWLEFLYIPTGLTFISFPHLWSFLFFSMWILGSLNILIVHLLSFLTSLFDEFEVLRQFRTKITLGAIGFFTLTSIIFCSNNGFYLIALLSIYMIIAQAALNLLLLLIFVWIYGRKRFQFDVKFMTSRSYSTATVYMVRFVTPIALIFVWLAAMTYAVDFERAPGSLGSIAFLVGTITFVFCWCLIPGYCFVNIIRTTGILGVRLRKCFRPSDWYPADPVFKQSYEEAMNNSSIKQ